MFNSKYPIVAVAMNQVSNIDFAIAVANAGAAPGLFLFEYVDYNGLDSNLLEKDLIKFFKNTNSDLIVSTSTRQLEMFPDLISILHNVGVKYIELVEKPHSYNIVHELKLRNINVFTKLLEFTPRLNKDLIDGIIFKSNAAAGRVSQTKSSTLTHVTELFKDEYNNKILVPSGGIYSSSQVIDLLNIGATAVGVGTLLALSAESPIPLETKRKLLGVNASMLSAIKTPDGQQKAFVFDNVEGDDGNNTAGLRAGIQTGNHGHVFLGNAVDYVTEIKPVTQIIQELCTQVD